MTDVAVGRAARDLADQLEWPCIQRWLALPQGRVRTVGSGRLIVDGDALVIEGKKSLQLPDGADVRELLDPDEFRRQLATETGVVPDPPEASRRQPTAAEGVVLHAPEASRVQPISQPPGFIYKPDFITEEQEAKLLECIDGAQWSTELRRRVQHYGWRYDYTKRQIDESMLVGELPEWAQTLARKLADDRLMKDLPDQLIVNEYRGKQGISPHIDEPRSFTEQIATISLLETWGMVFRLRDSKDKIEKPLERRSVAVLTGDSRSKWTHEIPKRANEPRVDQRGKRTWEKRGRRISLTFRKTRLRQMS